MSEYNRRMASRTRKQRFPHPDRRRSSSFLQSSPFSDNGYDSDENFYTPSKRSRPSFGPTPRGSAVTKGHTSEATKPEPKEGSNSSNSGQTSRLDKRARDEHNEQERSRRRELAVIYELIRCSFTQEDLRHLGPGNAPKSIDKLSYPQVLQIAYHVVREENHNLQLFERTVSDMKRLEKEFSKQGLPVPGRPFAPNINDIYRKIVGVVDNLLKHDKSARSNDGSYETTPAQRAAYGDYQLAFLRPKSYHEALSTSSGSPPPSTPQSISPPTSSYYSHRSMRPPTTSSSYSVLPPRIAQPIRPPVVVPTCTTNSGLPRICTVFKNTNEVPLASPPPPIQDEIISSRTTGGGIEYVDEVDVPQIGSSLSLGAGDGMYFFGEGAEADGNELVTEEDPPIFPDMPL